jgi:hypothetical protein
MAIERPHGNFQFTAHGSRYRIYERDRLVGKLLELRRREVIARLGTQKNSSV